MLPELATLLPESVKKFGQMVCCQDWQHVRPSPSKSSAKWYVAKTGNMFAQVRQKVRPNGMLPRLATCSPESVKKFGQMVCCQDWQHAIWPNFLTDLGKHVASSGSTLEQPLLAADVGESCPESPGRHPVQGPSLPQKFSNSRQLYDQPKK
jgi:hypothetical protein